MNLQMYCGLAFTSWIDRFLYGSAESGTAVRGKGAGLPDGIRVRFRGEAQLLCCAGLSERLLPHHWLLWDCSNMADDQIQTR